METDRKAIMQAEYIIVGCDAHCSSLLLKIMVGQGNARLRRCAGDEPHAGAILVPREVPSGQQVFACMVGAS
jgi:hypothetical protein